jgi:hypothetical protein
VVESLRRLAPNGRNRDHPGAPAQRVAPPKKGGFAKYWPFREARAGAASTKRLRIFVANKRGSASRIRTSHLLVDKRSIHREKLCGLPLPANVIWVSSPLFHSRLILMELYPRLAGLPNGELRLPATSGPSVVVIDWSAFEQTANGSIEYNRVPKWITRNPLKNRTRDQSSFDVVHAARRTALKASQSAASISMHFAVQKMG